MPHQFTWAMNSRTLRRCYSALIYQESQFHTLW